MGQPQKFNMTNEKIRAKFDSQFDLVNYAIRLAENMILTGRAPLITTETQNENVALQIMMDLATGRETFVEIKEIEEPVIPPPEQFKIKISRPEEKSSSKLADIKKARKVLAD